MLEAIATLRGESGFEGADAMRSQEGNTQKLVARQLAGRIFRGWTQQSAQLANLDQPGQPLALSVRLTKSRALKPAGADFLLPLPFDSRLLQTWGDRAERTLPFQIRDADATTWEVTVVPGPHWQVVAPPPQAQERRQLLDYALATRRVADGLELRRDARILPGEIAPAQFAEWLDLLRKVDQFEEGGIRMAKRDG
jgi:hypothetical protein